MIRELASILNNALNQNYYTARWKLAKVIPILKKGKNPTDFSSYRPISLTCNLSKIFEKLIKSDLNRFLNSNNIIPHNQFGFKSKHSTVHAIHKLSSDVNRYLSNAKIVGAVLIDIEKAFDSVWLEGLIYKLQLTKFPTHLTYLITGMIYGKAFITFTGNEESTIVLSPILFNVYTADLTSECELKIDNESDSITFADDLITYVAGNDVTIIQNKLNNHIENINNYYLRWNLRLNPAKCETILFRKTVNEISFTSVQKLKTFQITLKQQALTNYTDFIIPNKTSVCYLGVHFDYLMRMNLHHIKQLEKTKKAFRSCSKLFYNKNINPKAKIICYQ